MRCAARKMRRAAELDRRAHLLASTEGVAEEEEVAGCRGSEVRWWCRRTTFVRALVLAAAMVIALQAGTTNAFNTIATHIQNDTGLSNGQITLLSSVGIIGTSFTMFAGLFNDRFGAMLTSLIGAVLTSSGYLAMSFTDKDTYPAMVASLTIIGFGSGASFLGALSTGLKVVPGYPGVGVALVGACMSISLALTNGIVEFDREVLGCAEDDCWPYYLRSLAVTTATFLFAPSFLLCLLPPDADSKAKQPQRPTPAYHTIQGDDWSEQELARDLFAPAGEVPEAVLVDEALKAGQTDSPVSLLHSLNALGNLFFWLLIFGYFSGIGSAVAIITSNKEIWVTFTGGEHAGWAVQITTGFSIANTIANVLSGWASDFLWTKFKFARHKLLALALLLDFVVFTVLVGLSYGIAHPSTAAQIVFVVCLMSVGFCFGTYLSLVPIIVGDYYGYVNFGLYFGYIQLGALVAVFLVPNLAQVIKDSVGDFNVIFVALLASLGVSFAGIFLKRPTPIRHDR